MPRTVIVIGGPTASGKSALAVELAEHFGTEVIGADARQFYRDLPIGTGQPTDEERRGVHHHFIGHLDLDQDMSAATYAREAIPVLHDLLDRHGRAIVVGGSGLYIDALLFELDPLPPAQPKLRAELQALWKKEGLRPLQQELAHLDPKTWRSIDRNNPHRLIRAIEICRTTGKPVSAQRTGRRPRPDLHPIFIALDLPRMDLYARIDARVDAMIASGLEEEARHALPHRDRNALNTVGYKELFAHFDGRMDRGTTIGLIKQHTRNYARRQSTWLRRDVHWHWVNADDLDRVIAMIEANEWGPSA
ncbi:MAG: tRNA (adenosine(37)-N6)-dimethylallyltransferase MiaA [Flavobacteriales bacterium]|nr:tRNA (adenosine(37)-N6)-dimethylallyltransferase MiaA [Flavobacteriales bacterium]MCB9193827.1 tRNA (adenosine(37)-N6)-dimethylallyltransferase MiaA [Flavobacteriales bacterium]